MREYIRVSRTGRIIRPEGKPDRDRPISADDITNLVIALGNAQDCLDILRDQHIFALKR